MTGLTAKAFSSLQYKELKTTIFRIGKPQSILHYLSKLYMRGDSTYSIGFGILIIVAIKITVVHNVTWYNLVKMQQFVEKAAMCIFRIEWCHIPEKDDHRKHVSPPFSNQTLQCSVTHSLLHLLKFDF